MSRVRLWVLGAAAAATMAGLAAMVAWQQSWGSQGIDARAAVIGELEIYRLGRTGSGMGGGGEGGSELSGIAVDAKGVVWLADTGGHRILRLTPDGKLEVAAGSGEPGWTDGVGTEARFYRPGGMVALGDGSLLIADFWNACVRRLHSDGRVETVVGVRGRCRGLETKKEGEAEQGSGQPPEILAPTDGPAEVAVLNQVADVELTPYGLLIADSWMLRLLTQEGDVLTLFDGMDATGPLVFFGSVAWNATKQEAYATNAAFASPASLFRLRHGGRGWEVERLRITGPVRLGDVAVCPDGSVFATDSDTGRLFRVFVEEQRAEVVYLPPEAGRAASNPSSVVGVASLACTDAGLYVVVQDLEEGVAKVLRLDARRPKR